MSIKKRLLAGVLATTSVFSFASCSKDDNSSNNNNSNAGPVKNAEGTVLEAKDLSEIIPKETIKLDVYSQVANYSGQQNGWFAKVMKDKFNVELNIIDSPDGTFETRMEGDNLGDIVVFGNEGDFAKAAKAGKLLDWEDEDILKDYGPYLNANFQEAFEKNKNIKGSDGKLHGFGSEVGVSADGTNRAMFFYHPSMRFDLYNEIGCPEINTLEDYVEVFEKMKKACPKSDSGKDTYAVSMFSAWDGDMVMFVKATAALYGYDEFGFGLYNLETQEYQDALDPNGMYLRCLKFYNTLNQKGLVKPDSVSQTFEDCLADYKDGAAFFNLFTWMSGDQFNTPAHTEAGKGMYAIPPKDAKNFCDALNLYGNERVWSIGSKTQYPELCMAIINYFSTPEGFMTTQHGPKGVTWDYDKDGNTYLTDLGKSAKSDKAGTKMPDEWGGGSFEDGEFKINLVTSHLDDINPDSKTGETYNHKAWKTFIDTQEYPQVFQDWQKWSGYKTEDEFLDKEGHKTLKIGSTYTPTEKSKELSATWEQVQGCIKDYSWKAILAKSDDEYNKIVEEMTKKAKEYGYDQCVEYQKNEAELRKAAEDKAKEDIAAKNKD